MLQSYENWLYRVDTYLLSLCGLGSGSFREVAFCDMYLESYTPERAAHKAMRLVGYGGIL